MLLLASVFAGSLRLPAGVSAHGRAHTVVWTDPTWSSFVRRYTPGLSALSGCYECCYYGFCLNTSSVPLGTYLGAEPLITSGCFFANCFPAPFILSLSSVGTDQDCEHPDKIEAKILISPQLPTNCYLTATILAVRQGLMWCVASPCDYGAEVSSCAHCPQICCPY